MNKQQTEKILIYAFSLSGGAGGNLARISSFLANNGFSVRLCYAKADSRCMRLLNKHVEYTSFNVNRSWEMIPKLIRELRTNRYDLILVNAGTNASTIILTMLIAKKWTPYIIRESNSPSEILKESGLISRWIKTRLRKIAYDQAEKIISVSMEMAEELNLRWQVPKEKLTVIYNGVSIPDSQQIKCLKSSQITDCNSERTVTILTVGRLTPQKDHATLLRAFAGLSVSGRARLVIVGDGPEQRKLQDLTATLGITDRVEFTGYVNDPGNSYRAADVFVLSSRFEGFPNVLIEALAHGVPVVSTDCPTGPREILDYGSFGELVPVGDVFALRSAIERTITKTHNPEELQNRARRFDRTQQLDACRNQIESVFASRGQR